MLQFELLSLTKNVNASQRFSLSEFLNIMKIMMDKEESFNNCSSLVFPYGFVVVAFLSNKFKACY